MGVVSKPAKQKMATTNSFCVFVAIFCPSLAWHAVYSISIEGVWFGGSSFEANSWSLVIKIIWFISKILIGTPFLTYYAKLCDNLLVEEDVFTIVGVSFCVMQNAFNSIKIYKNKNIVAQFRKSSIQLYYYFFNWWSYWVLFVSHNFFSLWRLRCRFWWILDQHYFSHKLARVLRSFVRKKV